MINDEWKASADGSGTLPIPDFVPFLIKKHFFSFIAYIPHLEDVNLVAVSNVAGSDYIRHWLISVLLSKGHRLRTGPQVFQFVAASGGSS